MRELAVCLILLACSAFAPYASPARDNWSIEGVEIGMTAGDVLCVRGEPDIRFDSSDSELCRRPGTGGFFKYFESSGAFLEVAFNREGRVSWLQGRRLLRNHRQIHRNDRELAAVLGQPVVGPGYSYRIVDEGDSYFHLALIDP